MFIFKKYPNLAKIQKASFVAHQSLVSQTYSKTNCQRWNLNPMTFIGNIFWTHWEITSLKFIINHWPVGKHKILVLNHVMKLLIHKYHSIVMANIVCWFTKTIQLYWIEMFSTVNPRFKIPFWLLNAIKRISCPISKSLPNQCAFSLLVRKTTVRLLLNVSWYPWFAIFSLLIGKGNYKNASYVGIASECDWETGLKSLENAN